MSASPAPAQDLLALALGPARAAGAEAQATLTRSDHWSASVANGAIEHIADSTARALSLRVLFADGRHAAVSTTDLDPALVRRLAAEAVGLARATEPDPWAGLAPLEACGQQPVAGLHDEGAGFTRELALAQLLEAESLARARDPRITASHRCGTGMAHAASSSLDTRGLGWERRSSRYGYSLSLVAEHGGERQSGHAATAGRRFQGLRPPAAVAEEAATRCVRGFGWSRPRSGPTRVLFDARVASGLLGLAAGLASGASVYRGASCWAEARGGLVGSPLLEVVDDPTIPGALGSRACDSEGVRSQPLTLIAGGRLGHFLTDAYAARRLGLPCTGHADGTSNLRLRPGPHPPAALLRLLGSGLLVSEVQGHGVDLSSGQWSKGASGFWVEDGEIRHPVQGVTLAGRLQDIFRGLEAVGDDPLPEHAVSSPSLLVGELVLGGQA